MNSEVICAVLIVQIAIASVSGQLCVAETNNERAKNGGLPPLKNNPQLVKAAKIHNDLMIATNCFSHQCTSEPAVGDRVIKAGYRWSRVAENIAAGSRDCVGAMDQWMHSTGHRKNIMGDHVEVGCAMGACSSCSYPVYWTCVYARPMGGGGGGGAIPSLTSSAPIPWPVNQNSGVPSQWNPAPPSNLAAPAASPPISGGRQQISSEDLIKLLQLLSESGLGGNVKVTYQR